MQIIQSWSWANAATSPPIYVSDLQGDLNSLPVACLRSVTLQLIFADYLQIQLIFADHLHIQLIFADHLYSTGQK